MKSEEAVVRGQSHAKMQVFQETAVLYSLLHAASGSKGECL